MRCLTPVVFLFTIGTIWCGPIVLNSSFEQDVLSSPYIGTAATVPDWTYTGPETDVHYAVGYSDPGGSVTTAGQGNEFVVLGDGIGNGFGVTASWSQDVSGFTVGAEYVLSFMVAGETSALFWPIGAEVIDTSATQSQGLAAPASSAGYYFSDWETFSMIFTANAPTEEILFSSATTANIGLDDVSIAPVPEPVSWGLLGTAIAVLILKRAGSKVHAAVARAIPLTRPQRFLRVSPIARLR